MSNLDNGNICPRSFKNPSTPLQLSCQSLQVLGAALRSPWSHFFSRLNNPNSLSLSAQQRGSSPLSISTVSSGLAPTASCLSYVEGLREDTALHGEGLTRAEQSRAEGENPLPRPAGDVAHGMVGFLCCKHTLLGQVELLIHQHPTVLLLRAALHPFSAQPVPALGIAPAHMQNLALGASFLLSVRSRDVGDFPSTERAARALCQIKVLSL